MNGFSPPFSLINQIGIYPKARGPLAMTRGDSILIDGSKCRIGLAADANEN